MRSTRDIDYMEHADGELETELDRDGRAKVEAIHELGELVRGRLERAADELPEARLAAMWRDIDRRLDPPQAPAPDSSPVPIQRGALARWLDRYRGYVVTAAVSAGAVAALALVLRGGGGGAPIAGGAGAIGVMPVVHRPSEIEELDTPGGNGTVFNLEDEDGNTTVIWVTPADTVEGL